MGTAINFEDLFDFSPEPVDREQSDYVDEPVEPSPKLLYPVRPSQSPKTSSKLSASLPTTWTSNLSASYTGSSSPGSSGYGGGTHGSVQSSGHGGSGELFGHLVEDLSAAVAAGSSAPEVRGKRGRKPGQKNSKPDMKNKLERSRQSARECRARKKLRYQYLDDLILEREKANIKLREELLRYQAWCHELDKGKIPDGLKDFVRMMKAREGQQSCYQQL